MARAKILLRYLYQFLKICAKKVLCQKIEFLDKISETKMEAITRKIYSFWVKIYRNLTKKSSLKYNQKIGFGCRICLSSRKSGIWSTNRYFSIFGIGSFENGKIWGIWRNTSELNSKKLNSDWLFYAKLPIFETNVGERPEYLVNLAARVLWDII